MFRSAALALTTTAALALPACGTTTDADAVRQVIGGWWSALADDRGDDACSALLPAARAQFEERLGASMFTGCRGLVTGVHTWMTPEQRKAATRFRVRRVLFSDHGRVAVVRDEDMDIPDAFQADRDDRPTRLRKVNGVWKIEDFG